MTRPTTTSSHSFLPRCKAQHQHQQLRPALLLLTSLHFLRGNQQASVLGSRLRLHLARTLYPSCRHDDLTTSVVKRHPSRHLVRSQYLRLLSMYYHQSKLLLLRNRLHHHLHTLPSQNRLPLQKRCTTTMETILRPTFRSAKAISSK